MLSPAGSTKITKPQLTLWANDIALTAAVLEIFAERAAARAVAVPDESGRLFAEAALGRVARLTKISEEMVALQADLRPAMGAVVGPAAVSPAASLSGSITTS
jgi:hypothetical protein